MVVEAAAGGTGSLAVQLAKRAGAKVIGLASSDEKRALVERLGADATADSRAEGRDGMKEAILEANGGEKVDVVLHMSGTGFEGQLDALAPARADRRASATPPATRTRSQTNYLLQSSKSVLGFWLMPFDRPEARADRLDDRRAARRGGRRTSWRWWSAGSIPLSRRRQGARRHRRAPHHRQAAARSDGLTRDP